MREEEEQFEKAKKIKEEQNRKRQMIERRLE
jgi:hypothetical protein